MDLSISHNILDLVLVVSLAILALTSIVFLIFLVPVFIQLTKTLEAANALVTTLRDYTHGLTSGIGSISESVIEFGSKIANFVVSLKDSLFSVFNKR